MTKPYRPIPYEEVLAQFPPDQQARIKARAAELIAEEFAFRELHRAKPLAPKQIATMLDGKQVHIYRPGKRGDMKLSSLRSHVRALGGDLQLIVTFPEGGAVKIRDIGATTKRKRKAPGSSKAA